MIKQFLSITNVPESDDYNQNVARVWSIGAFDQMRCAIDQFVISAAFYQLRNS